MPAKGTRKPRTSKPKKSAAAPAPVPTPPAPEPVVVAPVAPVVEQVDEMPALTISNFVFGNRFASQSATIGR